MRRIAILGWLALLPAQDLVLASADSAFLQLARTTKREGPPPATDVIPGVVGVPRTRSGKGTAQDQFLNTGYLRELQRRRFETQGLGAGQQVSTTEAAATGGTPSGVAPKTVTSTVMAPAPPLVPPPTPAAPPGVQFSFKDAAIDTVVDQIMRELGYSYVIDPQVSGTVNLFTMRAIPRDRMFEVLEQILKMNGQGIVKQEGLYIIAPIGQTTKVPHQILVQPPSRPAAPPVQPTEDKRPKVTPEQPPTPAPKPSEAPAAEPGTAPPTEQRQAPPPGPVVLSTGPSRLPVTGDEEGIVTYVMPLHYVASEYMKQMVQVFVSDGANLIDFAPANILIVTDHRKNINQILELVDLIDTQYFSINTADLIAIRHNLARDVAEDLGKVFAPGDKSSVRIVAIERLNSILVVTHAPTVLQELKNWIERLDAPSASTNIKTFVYQVENNTAGNIAEVLAQLYQDGMGLPSSSTSESREGQTQTTTPATQPAAREPGFLPSQYSSAYSSYGRGAQAGIRSELGPSLTGRPMTSQAGVKAVVSGNVKIIVNDYNNSLIVQATQIDYNFLLETIKQLDVLPRQVLIEAKIYSVELRDELNFGVAAFLQKRGASATGTDSGGVKPPTTGQITAPSGSSPGGALSMATRTFIGRDRELEVLINALRSQTNVEIVESPRLVAMDGMQATFNVGAEVPVTTASFGDPLRSGTSTSFINSIQFRPTGTTLLIVPRISASGIVTMDLAIEVSSATGTALTPTINRNYVETSLIVRDGQTVAIAGIISDQFNFGRNRVPVLGDIPILGALFGQTTRDKRRAELIFLITPHVIPNLPTAAELTLEFRRAMRKAYDFIRQKELEESQLIQKRREEELENQSRGSK